MNRPTLITAAVMFGAPFILLATCYTAIPAQVPVIRMPLSHAMAVATKSVFTVFRVPLINLIHGLMAAVMLARATDFEHGERRGSYAGIWATLLFTIALKSDFEALELGSLALPVALRSYSPWFTAGTVLSVLSGLTLALIRGRHAPVPWPELHLRLRDKIVLATLFAFFIGLVIASVRASHPA